MVGGLWNTEQSRNAMSSLEAAGSSTPKAIYGRDCSDLVSFPCLDLHSWLAAFFFTSLTPLYSSQTLSYFHVLSSVQILGLTLCCICASIYVSRCYLPHTQFFILRLIQFLFYFGFIFCLLTISVALLL